jgi:class 3 adenylate cyclase
MAGYRDRANRFSSCPLDVGQPKTGIATGLVVVGHRILSGESEERGMVGETPNLAARLQSIAEPNMVVIAESTQRHRPGPGVAAARRPPSQHRYPQRYRHRRHRALARALRAVGGRWRDGGRIADGELRSRRSQPAPGGITATTWPGPI